MYHLIVLFSLLLFCAVGARAESATATTSPETLPDSGQKAAQSVSQQASAAIAEHADNNETAVGGQITSYMCTYGKLARRIEVGYETDKPVPCQVMYHKRDTDGSWVSKSVWNSRNEIGYCEARASEFADKHRDWGWACEAGFVRSDSHPDKTASPQKPTKPE